RWPPVTTTGRPARSSAAARSQRMAAVSPKVREAWEGSEAFSVNLMGAAGRGFNRRGGWNGVWRAASVRVPRGGVGVGFAAAGRAQAVALVGPLVLRRVAPGDALDAGIEGRGGGLRVGVGD